MKQKSCPRCKKGDLALDRDHHGWYQYCIQCGYMCDLISVTESEQEANHSDNKKGPVVHQRGDLKRA